MYKLQFLTQTSLNRPIKNAIFLHDYDTVTNVYSINAVWVMFILLRQIYYYIMLA